MSMQVSRRCTHSQLSTFNFLQLIIKLFIKIWKPSGCRALHYALPSGEGDHA
jgi:hypothetical protein